MREGLRRLVGVLALVGVTAGCTQLTAGRPIAVSTSRTTPSGPVELTVATFGESPIAELLDEYRTEHPDVTINHDEVPLGTDYYQKLATRFAAGDPPDVVLVEDSRLPEFHDQLHDLAEIGPDDVSPEQWLDWKYEGGRTGDGDWVGYGVDSAPLAMAYRTDMFAAAGLPADPSELFASWESYLAAGDGYVRATGKPWFDSSTFLFMAMHDQLDTGYFDEDDNLVIESNQAIRANWDRLTAAAAAGQSAKLTPFSVEWLDALRTDSFATMLAPPWMLGVMAANAGPGNAGKWAIATAFPGGGGRWGGSYLAVPRGTEHPEAAAELAAWLTAPDQQLAMFRAANLFPSQVEPLASAEVRDSKHDFMGDLPTGQRYAELAGEVAKPHYRSRYDVRVHEQAITPALRAVEAGTPADQGWQQAVAAAKEIAGG